MSLDVYLSQMTYTEVYSRNITHNLGRMASAVSEEFYKALWRPEELKITQAHELIPFLLAGVAKLAEDPDTYKALEPENGWGDYDGLFDFATSYIIACMKYPNANVSVSR